MSMGNWRATDETLQLLQRILWASLFSLENCDFFDSIFKIYLYGPLVIDSNYFEIKCTIFWDHVFDLLTWYFTQHTNLSGCCVHHACASRLERGKRVILWNERKREREHSLSLCVSLSSVVFRVEMVVNKSAYYLPFLWPNLSSLYAPLQGERPPRRLVFSSEMRVLQVGQTLANEECAYSPILPTMHYIFFHHLLNFCSLIHMPS